MKVTIRRNDESFVVHDESGTGLAYVYFEEEPTRRSVMKRLTKDRARTIAQRIARALQGDEPTG